MGLHRLFIGSILGLGVMALGQSVSAETEPTVCGARDDVAASLARKFDETPVSIGVNKEGSVFEVFVSPQGTWTMLVTQPNGNACVVSVGDGWVQVDETAQGEPI